MLVRVLSGTVNPAVVEDLSLLCDSLEFSTALPGLNDRASVGVSNSASDVFIRFLTYLGRRIVIYDDNNEAAWDGLIWSIEADLGGHTLGPKDLGSVWNYVLVEYADMLDSNKYAQTAYISDLNSQALYGIKEQILPYGEMTSSAATKAVNRYSVNHADPFISGNLSIPLSGNSLGLKINAVGYWATTHYRKFQSALTTTCTVQTRIQEIVNQTVTPALPASSKYLEFFSTETGLIEGTNLTIARATLHVETAGSYLQRIVSLGDNSNNTWYIGAETGEEYRNNPMVIGAPRMKVWSRPSVPEFFVSARDGKVFSKSGQPVHPSKVRAGNYIQLIDVLPQMLQTSQWLDRVRGFILAETHYDAIRGSLSGRPEGQDSDVDMILARMG